ncbi:MAG: pyruvate dehydrogenase [Bdellovibrionales bacterium]|nr:pyruvate dehydrogenase [Bdellovibrionales bacterium]
MIYTANTRGNVEKGDPKIGGHSSASSSALHILGALHMVMKSGYDWIANKPHASPADHAYNYLMDVLVDKDLNRLTLDQCNHAMRSLRAFPTDGEPVFQSYHSAYDPDNHNFYPSGTVGIPPVNAGYMALAYNYAERHGFEVPKGAHFWSIMGDSEFREGSLSEAIPDLGERQVGNLTWILDFNRQSLDGFRITNKKAFQGNDDVRIERMMEANGWHVVHARHGQKRLKLAKKDGGQLFLEVFEGLLSDYELQVMLLLPDDKALRAYLLEHAPKLEKFLKGLGAEELRTAVHDFGGHDFETLIQAYEASRLETERPTMVIAHTIKGWGLKMAANPGNHSAIPDEAELKELAAKAGIPEGVDFARFDDKSPEGKFMKARGEKILSDMRGQQALKEKNKSYFTQMANELGGLSDSMDINFKMANYPHTQWMLGQLTAKLTRLANTPLDEKKLKDKQKPLTESEKRFKLAAEMLISMAPDVGTSTNLNPSMDGKIYGPDNFEDEETRMGVKDRSVPDLVSGEEVSDRFLRFDIAEANVMSCVGSFGKIRDTLGIPLIPLMTVYDFFIKRAHDQLFYNLYWRSSFILVGTPSGVTLSPEGAQHGWKSDFQIPGQITWEPLFVQELDWIFSDALKRILTFDDHDRNGVVIRGVTRGVDQKMFMGLLKTQARYKAGWDESIKLAPQGVEVAGGTDESSIPALDEAQILEQVREDVLAGGYYLIDYRGYAGYEPGDNVINVFAMGSPATEAIKASRALLEKGIYANVIVVTSPDLLLGNLAHENDYHQLRQKLGINADLFLKSVDANDAGELRTLAGRRIPVVSVHDGEIGLLDNIGSLIGVRQETLAVRKHSKCGRPSDVYRYHHIDADSVLEACGRVLAETALENIVLPGESPRASSTSGNRPSDEWRGLWPAGGK